MVMAGSGFGGEGGMAGMGASMMGGGIEFDEKDVNSLERVSELDYVVPVFFSSVVVESQGEEEIGYVMGSNEEIFGLLNMEPVGGELFTKADAQRRSKEVVLGYTLAKELFGEPENGVGKTIRVGNQRYGVMGVIEKKGDNEMDRAVIIPYKTTFGSLNPDKTFFMIYLGVDDEGNIPVAKSKAEEVLLKRYEEDDFSVTEQDELLDVVNQIFNVLNGVLVAIGSISLLVGGIGIMNIMYANVTERTKEIGIRRAIGATKRDILYQFVAESVLLSGFGGMMGLLISALIVLAVRPWFPLALNFLSIVLAIGISTFIGVFFGVFPARRASNLTPIEAIRYE
jgi:putative ABC transport system permease protein